MKARLSDECINRLAKACAIRAMAYNATRGGCLPDTEEAKALYPGWFVMMRDALKDEADLLIPEFA